MVLDPGQETEHENVTPAFLVPRLSEAGRLLDPTIQHSAINASANTAVAWTKLYTVLDRIQIRY